MEPGGSGLLCCESGVDVVNRAHRDHVLLSDYRVVKNLLAAEERYLANPQYFQLTQKEIRPTMRKQLATWLLEVSEDAGCEEEVFPLAINYLDRYLSVVSVKTNQFQLLGAVCMFLASKMKETNPSLTAEKLCYYTGNSITVQELMEWEVIVLSRLKWDLSAITPHDFLEHVMSRLGLNPERHEIVRRHSQTFIALCATDFKFAIHTPSIICAASIGAAVLGLLAQERDSETENVLDRLSAATSIDMDVVTSCIEQIEEMVSLALDSSLEATTPSKAGSSNARQPETPTDVRDVRF